MTQITSHVLDTSRGKPAEGIDISLHRLDNDSYSLLGSALTNSDGRVSDFTGPGDALKAGTYKLIFVLDEYFTRYDIEAFYPHADIVFRIAGDGQHYHVPLLLNPFGYSTYRGS